MSRKHSHARHFNINIGKLAGRGPGPRPLATPLNSLKPAHIGVLKAVLALVST